MYTDMGEYESAINVILAARPEISRQDLDEKIAEKIKNVGGGFLTELGAIHLVASDLEVAVPQADVVEDLKDVCDGAKDVSLRTKVMNISPVKQFTGRDGTPGAIRTMTVYDNQSRMSVKLWNDKANLPEIDSIRSGDMIKIVKAYVKADRDGNPALNIGSGATLERDEDQESDIGEIDMLEIDASEVNEGGRNMVVTGKIYGQINDSEFTRKSDGRPGTLLRMTISGRDEKLVRAVLWGRTKRDVPKSIPVGSRVRLIGVDAKQSNQGIEIHGNDATVIEVEGTDDVPPRVVRIISRNRGAAGTMILGVDAKSGYAFITDSSGVSAEFEIGEVVEFMPATAFGSSMTLDSSSYARRVDNTDEKVPEIKDLHAKIESIKAGGTYVIKAIVIKANERQEIQTRAGNTIALAEIYVEDGTGQVWVKGWREQADMVAKCNPGEIYEITGLNARAGMEGRTDLMLSPYSGITRMDS